MVASACRRMTLNASSACQSALTDRAGCPPCAPRTATAFIVHARRRSAAEKPPPYSACASSWSFDGSVNGVPASRRSAPESPVDPVVPGSFISS
jgi:hypothetical protein